MTIILPVYFMTPGGEPEKGERCIFDLGQNERSGKTQAVRVYMGG